MLCKQLLHGFMLSDAGSEDVACFHRPTAAMSPSCVFKATPCCTIYAYDHKRYERVNSRAMGQPSFGLVTSADINNRADEGASARTHHDWSVLSIFAREPMP